MKLQIEDNILFACVCFGIATMSVVLLYWQLHKDHLAVIQTNTVAQLRHIAFSLTIIYR
jgi:hypothetical protein